MLFNSSNTRAPYRDGISRLFSFARILAIKETLLPRANLIRNPWLLGVLEGERRNPRKPFIGIETKKNAPAHLYTQGAQS
jgi:hypothetical protein